jgi:hypothetical protein
LTLPRRPVIITTTPVAYRLPEGVGSKPAGRVPGPGAGGLFPQVVGPAYFNQVASPPFFFSPPRPLADISDALAVRGEQL